AVAAAATLAGCLLWAVRHGNRRPVMDASTSAAAGAPEIVERQVVPTQEPPAPSASATEEPSRAGDTASTLAAGQGEGQEDARAEAPARVRQAPAKKRTTRPISNELTLDPFKQ